MDYSARATMFKFVRVIKFYQFSVFCSADTSARSERFRRALNRRLICPPLFQRYELVFKS